MEFLKKGAPEGEKKEPEKTEAISPLFIFSFRRAGGGSCMPLSLLKMGREGGRGGNSKWNFSLDAFPLFFPCISRRFVERERERERESGMRQ